MTSINIVGIVGSLRSASVQGAVARAAMNSMASNTQLSLFDVASVPLYNGDDEASGPPAAVSNLYDAVSAADGIVLFSPEYNGSIPAVTKNVIDWVSRKPDTWAGTAITMVVASPGPRAGAGARAHFSAIMPYQQARLFESTLGIGGDGDKLGADGELSDSSTLEELATFMADFAAFCRE